MASRNSVQWLVTSGQEKQWLVVSDLWPVGKGGRMEVRMDERETGKAVVSE